MGRRPAAWPTLSWALLHRRALPRRLRRAPAAAAAVRGHGVPLQQQLLFCVAMDLPSPGLMVLAGLFIVGSRAMRFLISAAMVINAWAGSRWEWLAGQKRDWQQGWPAEQQVARAVSQSSSCLTHSSTPAVPSALSLPHRQHPSFLPDSVRACSSSPPSLPTLHPTHLLDVAGVLGGGLNVWDANLVRKRLGGVEIHHALGRQIRLRGGKARGQVAGQRRVSGASSAAALRLRLSAL